jgi:hypothetical protein
MPIGIRQVQNKVISFFFIRHTVEAVLRSIFPRREVRPHGSRRSNARIAAGTNVDGVQRRQSSSVTWTEFSTEEESTFSAFAEFFAWYCNAMANGVAESLVAQRRCRAGNGLHLRGPGSPVEKWKSGRSDLP